MTANSARTALILGGDGQIGRAVSRKLLAEGWRVRLTRRSPGPPAPDLLGRVESLQLDRNTPGALAAALMGGVDAVVDTVAYNQAHARQWLEVQDDIGALVVISSAAVYRDIEGRSFDEAQGRGFPDFPVPITEDQPTVPPGDDRYATRKADLEQSLLQQVRPPLTLLRPGAIHGEGSRKPREWWFIKRILDGRRRAPLAYGGTSRFHTSATVNIAELVLASLEHPGIRILNAADPQALTVHEIGRAIALHYRVDLDLVPLHGPPVGTVGEHPWCVPKPVVLDMTRAEEIGYRPVVAYLETLAEVCRSAEAMAQAVGAFEGELAPRSFDYAAEDMVLAKA